MMSSNTSQQLPATPPTNPDPAIIQAMLVACTNGDLAAVQTLVSQHGPLYGCQQEEVQGHSPLMRAAAAGHLTLVHYLLENCNAPWNAVDRQGQCAGNYATQQEHWEIVTALVDWGTRAELLLGLVERQQHKAVDTTSPAPVVDGPVEYQPCTKPDYLRQRLQFRNDALLDADQDGVMMEWERPLMKAHADVLMQECQHKRVLNIGFGMGIIDGYFQEYAPNHHIIIEAHPDVYQQMRQTGWHEKKNVRVCFGKWQDVIPQLIAEGVVVDGIFFDTYGEHYLDMEDFHQLMAQILAKPHGVYSFFNGLAPDNIFFHGVACQCVQVQLSSIGLDSEFVSCEIQVKDEVWENIRRKYWHGRDTYYLPIVKWNAKFLTTGKAPSILDSPLLKRKNDKEDQDGDDRMEEDTKRVHTS